MSGYNFPNLSNFEIIFNGRRYKAFKVSNFNPFEGYEEYAEFVVWDGVYDAAVSYGNINASGSCDGFLAFSHVEIQIDFSANISEFIKNSRSEQLRYLKDTGT
jgi:hypothetical protein